MRGRTFGFLLFYLFAGVPLAGFGLSGCEKGCPSGTREYNGDCVPESSEQINSGPSYTDGDQEQAEISFPTPEAATQDYNELPGGGGGTTIDDPSSIQVEEGTRGLIVWVKGHEDNLIWPNRLTAPDGTVVYDFMQDAQNEAINDEFAFHFYPNSSLSVFLPNTPRLSLQSGEYSLEVSSYESGNELTYTVYEQDEGRGESEQTHLSVNLWFVGLSSVWK